jgi:hypothetical protein
MQLGDIVIDPFGTRADFGCALKPLLCIVHEAGDRFDP